MIGQQVTNSETKVEQQVNVNVQPGATLIIGASNSTPAPAAPRDAPAYAFISYAPVDTLLAMALGRALLAAGVRPWLEIWDRGAGSDGDVRRREAMRDAAVLLVCSGQGRGSEPSEFAGRVLHLRMARSDAGALEIELDDGTRGIETLASRIGVYPDRTRWLELEAAALGVEPDALRPYRGLEAFKEQHARWMFGRDEELAKLVELAREQSLLTVIGASGSGKSSLVMGGLCPALRSGMLGARVTMIGYLRPGKRPCESLAEALVALGPPLDPVGRGMKVAELRDAMQHSPDLLRVIARQLDAAAPHKSVLVLDQLEELFTEARLGQEGESPEARPFVHNIVAATSGEDAPLWIVSTLRADFLPHCLDVAELARTLNAGTYFALPAMRKDQVREAVELPARRVGFEVEQGVVVELVKGAAEHAGRLPLLEHVLGELWERRNEQTRTLTFDAYQAAGGLEGAIAAAAARGLASLRKHLGEQALPLTRRVMSRLVNIGETAQSDTRRRATIDELGRDDQTRCMLDVFVREARVLVSDGFDGREVIEIAHEALLREWSILRGWLDADREALRMRDAIGRAAKDYALRKKREYLWGKARVDEARVVVAKSSVELDTTEQGFLDASARAARGTLAGVIGAFIVLAVLMVYAFAKARDAEESVAVQKGFRASSIVSGGGSYFDAAKLSLEAVGTFRHGQVEPLPSPVLGGIIDVMSSAPAFEVAIITGHTARVTNVVFSPDGTRVATSSSDTARLWDVGTGEFSVTLTGHSGTITDIDFSPSGMRIATSSHDTTARLWDAGSGASLATFSGHDFGVTSIAFSPDGTRLATSSLDDTARLWDVETGDLLTTLKGHSGAVIRLAFSPDGTRLTTVSEEYAVRLWDLESGQLFTKLTGHSGLVRDAAFSPDGTFVATASEDSTMRLWDVETGEPLANLTGHTSGVTGVDISPDGTRIATSSWDKTARLWEVKSGSQLATLSHSVAVSDVLFSHDGTRLVTYAGTAAYLWDVVSGESLATLAGHSKGITGIAVSMDDTRLVTSSIDMTARLWDIASNKPLAVLNGHSNTVVQLEFSPNSTRIVTASNDRTARLWDVSSGDLLATLDGHSKPVSGVGFSPDGAHIVTASGPTARVWDVATGEAISSFTRSADVTAMAFAPNGTLLAVSNDDGTTQLWDMGKGVLLVVLTGQARAITSLAFSPDGTRIATSSDDGAARVWDVASGKSIIVFGDSASLNTVEFSPDGTRIVTSGVPNAAQVWDAASGRLQRTFTGHGLVWGVASLRGATFSHDGTRLAAYRGSGAWIWDVATGDLLSTLEGHTLSISDIAFSPDGAFLATSSDDNSVRMWDSSSGKLQSVLLGHTGVVTDLAFSPDGTHLASASYDNTAIIWPMPPLPLALCNRIRNATRYREVAEICETYHPL